MSVMLSYYMEVETSPNNWELVKCASKDADGDYQTFGSTSLRDIVIDCDMDSPFKYDLPKDLSEETIQEMKKAEDEFKQDFGMDRDYNKIYSCIYGGELLGKLKEKKDELVESVKRQIEYGRETYYSEKLSELKNLILKDEKKKSHMKPIDSEEINDGIISTLDDFIPYQRAISGIFGIAHMFSGNPFIQPDSIRLIYKIM